MSFVKFLTLAIWLVFIRGIQSIIMAPIELNQIELINNLTEACPAVNETWNSYIQCSREYKNDDPMHLCSKYFALIDVFSFADNV